MSLPEEGPVSGNYKQKDIYSKHDDCVTMQAASLACGSTAQNL